MHLAANILSKMNFTELKLHILSVYAFLGNQTHDLSVACAVLYCLSRNRNISLHVISSVGEAGP